MLKISYCNLFKRFHPFDFRIVHLLLKGAEVKFGENIFDAYIRREAFDLSLVLETTTYLFCHAMVLTISPPAKADVQKTISAPCYRKKFHPVFQLMS